MTSERARAEFDLRYYRWALGDFEREIGDGFPFLAAFSTGNPVELLDIMSQMSRKEQLTLASALVKRFHTAAVRLADERITEDEAAAIQKYFDRRQNLYRMETNHQPNLRPEGGPDRSNLVRRVKAELKTLDMQLLEVQNQAGVLTYQTRIDGWQVLTRIHTREKYTLLSYDHLIWSVEKVSPVKLGNGQEELWPIQLNGWISFTAWLGISSRTEWGDVSGIEIPEVAKQLAALCKHFLDAAPTLLANILVERSSKSLS